MLLHVHMFAWNSLFLSQFFIMHTFHYHFRQQIALLHAAIMHAIFLFYLSPLSYCFMSGSFFVSFSLMLNDSTTGKNVRKNTYKLLFDFGVKHTLHSDKQSLFLIVKNTSFFACFYYHSSCIGHCSFHFYLFLFPPR